MVLGGEVGEHELGAPPGQRAGRGGGAVGPVERHATEQRDAANGSAHARLQPIRNRPRLLTWPACARHAWRLRPASYNSLHPGRAGVVHHNGSDRRNDNRGQYLAGLSQLHGGYARGGRRHGSRGRVGEGRHGRSVCRHPADGRRRAAGRDAGPAAARRSSCTSIRCSPTRSSSPSCSPSSCAAGRHSPSGERRCG
jgi:hypothetical protein